MAMVLDHTTFFTVLKNSSYVLAFMASVEYLGFNPEVLVIFTILMVIDLITGIVRSIMVDGGSTFTSTAIRDGIFKKILLLGAIFTLGLAGRGVGFDLSPLIQASITVLILAETYSILGNIHSARTGKTKNEFDAVSFILKKLLDTINRSVK